MACVAPEVRAEARIFAKESCVVAGLPVAEQGLSRTGPRPEAGGERAGRHHDRTGQHGPQNFRLGRVDSHRRAVRPEFSPAAVRRCHANATFCQGGRRHEMPDPRHAQNNSRSACAPKIRGTLRRRNESSLRALRYVSAQGQSPRAHGSRRHACRSRPPRARIKSRGPRGSGG